VLLAMKISEQLSTFADIGARRSAGDSLNVGRGLE